MKKIIYLFLCFIFYSCGFYSCGFNNSEKDNFPDNITQQRINNSSKVICIYTDYGNWAWSSFSYKKAIVDSSKIFTAYKEAENLPYYIFDINIKSKTINCIEFINENEKGKNGIYEKQYDDMTLVIKKMRYIKGSNMGMFYKYNSFVEKRDSIFFDNVSIDVFGVLLPKKVGFKKGNIIAQLDSNGYVSKFNIDIVSTYSLWEKLRTKDTINMQYNDDFINSNLFELPAYSNVYQFDIEMKPDSTSKKQVISDYGIFKQIYIKNYNK